jgi:hypothetical protein
MLQKTCNSVSRPIESGRLVISLQSSRSSVSDDMAPNSAFISEGKKVIRERTLEKHRICPVNWISSEKLTCRKCGKQIVA